MKEEVFHFQKKKHHFSSKRKQNDISFYFSFIWILISFLALFPGLYSYNTEQFFSRKWNTRNKHSRFFFHYKFDHATLLALNKFARAQLFQISHEIGEDILSRNVQLNSWQAFIKPWDGFCGPLEVRTHPLPPPDSDCIMQDVKLQLLNLQWF